MDRVVIAFPEGKVAAKRSIEGLYKIKDGSEASKLVVIGWM